MPASAFSGSPGHPDSKEIYIFTLHLNSKYMHMLLKTVEHTHGKIGIRRPHLPGAALRRLGQVPQNNIVGTLQGVDDYLLTRKKKTNKFNLD